MWLPLLQGINNMRSKSEIIFRIHAGCSITSDEETFILNWLEERKRKQERFDNVFVPLLIVIGIIVYIVLY